MFNFLNKKEKKEEKNFNNVNKKTKLSKSISNIKTISKPLPFWQRMFNGAKISNTFSDWTPFLKSGNSHTTENFDLLIARCRDLYDNSPIIKKYISLCNQNIVGESGFILQTLSKDLIKNDIIEKRWKKFCEKENFEITKRLSYVEFLEVSVKSLKIDGEVLFINVIENGKYKTQIIDSMRINNQLNMKNSDNGNQIIGGVEVNDLGEIEALYIHDYSDQTFLKNHMIKNTPTIRISKENFNFVFKQENAEQLRGYPSIANVLAKVKNLDEFKEQALKAARIGVGYNLYLQQTEDNAPPLSIFSENAINEENEENIDNNIDNENSIIQKENQPFHTIEGNTEIMSMPKGYTVEGFQGKYPDQIYSSFNKTAVQEISAGLNVSPLFLGNDTSDINYATSKVIMNEEQISWRKEQNFIIENICSVIYKNWLKQELLNKIDYFDEDKKQNFTLTIDDYEELSKHKFYGRSWPHIDPLKEADAQEKLLLNKLTTKTKICAENGTNYEEVLKQLAKEKELEDFYFGKNKENNNNQENIKE